MSDQTTMEGCACATPSAAARQATNILLAGFGGQGILFAGKLLAYAGLLEGKEVSWLPSYGPEMRGGTANCSVVISSCAIGSPLVVEPDVLVAMNQPSLDAFIDRVAPGGIVIVDSQLVTQVPEREGVRVFEVPAAVMCEEAGVKGLANVLLAGKVVSETGVVTLEGINSALEKSIPPKRAHLLEPNKKAFSMGLELKGDERV